MKINLIWLLVILGTFSCTDHKSTKAKEQMENPSFLSDHKSFELTNLKGESHKVERLSEDEFASCQKKGLNELKGYYEKYGMRVYQTSEGAVIAEINGLYYKYPSFGVFTDLLNNPNRKAVVESLYGKNKYGKQFPSHVTSLITTLLDDFKISAKNKSKEQILAEVDLHIDRVRTLAFFEKYFLSFVALVGEYSRQANNGNWSMKLSDDNQTWIPFIVVGDKRIFFHDYIKEDVYNLNQKKPLTEVFETINLLVKS